MLTRDLEVQVGLATSDSAWRKATVNTLKLGLGGERNVWSESGEEEWQILWCIEVTLLKDTELVALRSLGGLADVVHLRNARGSDVLVAVGELELLGGVQDRRWDWQTTLDDGAGEVLVGTGTEATLLVRALAAVERTSVGGTSASKKLQTWGYVVDMAADVLGQVVLVTSNVLASGGDVLVVVVLGPQKTLGLLGGGIKLDPLLVDGLRDALGRNVGLMEPLADSVDSVLSWSKDVVNLFWREPLTESRRVGVRADCY